MVRPEPVEGYATKTDAIVALFQQGIDNHEIARRVGTTVATVRITARKKLGSSSQSKKSKKPRRNRGAETVSQAGVWTPKIMEQVRRLYGLTLIEIARAVNLPPSEVLRYVIHGVVPPNARVRRSEDIEWRDTERPGLPQPEAAPEPEPEQSEDAMDAEFEEIDPSREDDEAELAALAAAKPGKPALRKHTKADCADEWGCCGVSAAGPHHPSCVTRMDFGGLTLDEDERYYLRTAGGKYLHESCTGFVKEKGRNAYCQSPARIRRLFLRHPDFKDLIAERAE